MLLGMHQRRSIHQSEAVIAILNLGGTVTYSDSRLLDVLPSTFRDRLRNWVCFVVEVDLSETAAGDHDMHYIARLKQLESLSLERTQVTDKGLNDVRTLSRLIYLGLRESRTSGRGLEVIASLEQLQCLGLDESHLDERGVSQLANHPHRLGLEFDYLSEESHKILGELPHWVIQ